MKLKVKVEEFTFDINVGIGLNDFVWLSLAAARLYGKSRYPNGNYLPISLKIGPIMIHPRTKICDYFKKPEDFEELGEITVELQHPNVQLTADQQKWFDRAFGKDRNILHYEFRWVPEKDKAQVEKEKAKGITYKVRINYKMFPELSHEFNPADYKNQYDLPLIQSEEDNVVVYSAEIYLPFGDVTPQVILMFTPNKENKDEEIKPKNITFTPEQIDSRKEPNVISQSEMTRRIKENLKFMEEAAQRMELREEEKPEKSLSGICPFTFETLWNVIENNQEGDKNMNLDTLDENIREEVSKTLSENLNKLFEIFFQYTFLYEQPNEKKDELKISGQDMMHFLKFYQICPDSQSLFQFIDFYDVEKKRTKNLKATLSVSNGIKFPEFIVIILKAAHFLQTVNLISETENYNEILRQLVVKMLKIDSNDQEMNEFQKHIKYEMSLISFLRENSEKLMSIFTNKLQDSIQIAEKKYHMLREEIKSLIVESGFTGENIEDIINSCYHELMFENYQGFEGIFYHEFLQTIQWLSLVLVSDEGEINQGAEVEEKKDREEDVEEGVEILIEKMKYFLAQFKDGE